MNVIPVAEWLEEVERRGKLDCKFVCPVCGNAASPNDWKRLVPGADPDRAYRECIGRALCIPRRQVRRAFPTGEPDSSDPQSPCDYAAFGLIDLCTVHVQAGGEDPVPVFAFADEPTQDGS